MKEREVENWLVGYLVVSKIIEVLFPKIEVRLKYVINYRNTLRNRFEASKKASSEYVALINAIDSSEFYFPVGYEDYMLKIKTCFEEIRKSDLKNNSKLMIISSFIHMALNRLINKNNNEVEFLIYELLFKVLSRTKNNV